MRIIEASPYSEDAVQLMEELSENLEAITGSSGRASFQPEDVGVPGALFVIAYDDKGNAIGCGGYRPMEDNTAEVKRMYARLKHVGVGTQVLEYLERKAAGFGYASLRLETRLINKEAVSFYVKRGYHRIENYGKYMVMPEAVCFEKIVAATGKESKNEG